MMDLKEIIKWFIPCFHILVIKKVKMLRHLTYFALVLLFFARPSFAANVNTDSSLVSEINTKNLFNLDYSTVKSNRSVISDVKTISRHARSLDFSVGRTFGRPLKKLAAALIPLAFQMGAASTWAVVAAIVGVKTLLVSLVILKLLLLAGAVKIGTLFGHKAQPHGWEQPPQKEIHLHIHNGGHPGAPEEHIPISPWSRDGATAETSDANLVLNPYSETPQIRQFQNRAPKTISTPYGKYIRVESSDDFDISALQAKLAG